LNYVVLYGALQTAATICVGIPERVILVPYRTLVTRKERNCVWYGLIWVCWARKAL